MVLPLGAKTTAHRPQPAPQTRTPTPRNAALACTCVHMSLSSPDKCRASTGRRAQTRPGTGTVCVLLVRNTRQGSLTDVRQDREADSLAVCARRGRARLSRCRLDPRRSGRYSLVASLRSLGSPETARAARGESAGSLRRLRRRVPRCVSRCCGLSLRAIVSRLAASAPRAPSARPGFVSVSVPSS
jgi:hypothetical protein